MSTNKAMTKAAVVQHLAESSKLSRKQITEFLDALVKLAEQQLGEKGPGVFIIPGLLKIKADQRDEPSDFPPHLPKKVRRLINERRGQPKFREKLLSAYGGRCAVTGCDAEAALEAAHIRK